MQTDQVDSLRAALAQPTIHPTTRRQLTATAPSGTGPRAVLRSARGTARTRRSADDRRHHALVLAHLRVAEAVARRFASPSWDAHDLRQVAYLGLVKAARNFDAERGGEFVSYAVPTISGEVKRHLRDHGWFVRPPRPVQELRSRVIAESSRLAQSLGHVPSPAELATALGADVEQVREALRAGEHVRPQSLDAVDDESGSFGVGALDPGMERAERAATIAAACEGLDERERRILYLRFFEELTQQQIGAELGISQMHVSRLLSGILARLRERMTPPTPEPAAA